MCGINGFTFTDRKLVSKMNSILRHRGPDHVGVYCDDSISLGHLLLSLRGHSSRGKQPVTSKQSPWILLFNGQIYDTNKLIAQFFPEYRDDESHTDTELLYELIQLKGWNFIEYIQGMFALVVYNKEEQKVKLYRDSAGQKNLYYTVKENHLYFSSELKGLQCIPDLLSSKADKQAVALSTLLGYIPGKLTLFKEVYKVRPSEVITFDLNSQKLSTSYFNATDLNYYKDSKDIFQDLVQEHMLSSHEVVINLSGGLDSSLLLHEMRSHIDKVSSYTTWFDTKEGKYNSDAYVARKLAKDYHTQHTEIKVTKKSYLKYFKAAYLCVEEPNYNVSLPAYYQTAVVEGVKGDKKRVVLSGDGGDEVFGGYPEYLSIKKATLLKTLLTPFVFNRLKQLRSPIPFNFSRAHHMWLSYRMTGSSQVKGIEYKPLLDYFDIDAHDYFKLYKRNNEVVYQAMLCGRLFWLASENFIRSDKIFMSQSMELRSPLSYQPFRDYFDQQPIPLITKNNNKLYLRQYYKNKLPDYVLNKNKTGWRAPIQEWYDKEVKEFFLEIISRVEKNNYLVDWKSVRTKIEQSEKWPGKGIHLYLSLALLADHYNLTI